VLTAQFRTIMPILCHHDTYAFSALILFTE